MKKHELKKIGKQLVRREKELQQHINVEQNEDEIIKIIASLNLSVSDLLFLDTYIQKLLTK